jgi:hypothetical protein
LKLNLVVELVVRNSLKLNLVAELEVRDSTKLNRVVELEVKNWLILIDMENAFSLPLLHIHNQPQGS